MRPRRAPEKETPVEERIFRAVLKRANLPQPEAEYRFAPPRRWRFDYAWPQPKVALEVEGGVWIRGRHTRGKGYLADCEKYSEAASMGWLVLRTTPGALNSAETIDLIRRTLGHKR